MKILGIDYGRAKIGLAIAETQTQLVEPLDVWSSSKFKVQIQELTKRLGVTKIVVGVPGGKMEEEIKRFGEQLRWQTGLPVEYFDETLTSKDAQEILLKIKRKRKFRRAKEDAFAAAIMLESYLEGRLC